MKKGFTLAEVLITLGIIGVVAALTAPALVQNAGSAKVGPTLAKAVTTFEVANQNMLAATDSVSIKGSPAYTGSYPKTITTYIEQLSNYMKISLLDDSKSSKKYVIYNYDGKTSIDIFTFGNDAFLGMSLSNLNRKYALSKDGVLYIICLSLFNSRTDVALDKQKMGIVFIDINGKTNPNSLGKDIFAFSLAQDGTLRPIGSNQWSLTKSYEAENEKFNWQNGTKDKCNENEVTTGWSCAGSIYENNLKVIYQ